MSSQLEPPSSSYSLPPAVQRVANAFRLGGWVSFWAQAVLSVISTLVLLFAAANLAAPAAPVAIPGTVQVPTAAANPGTSAGSLFAAIGLFILLIGVYWSFRYTRLARRLKDVHARSRLRRSDAFQALQIGIMLSLAGILVTLLGAFSTVGTLFGRAVSQGFAVFTGNFSNYIRPIDLMVVQANINIILAHFIALVVSLWLLRTMSRSS